MGRALDPKTIKSARRVLEVFEYFHDGREQGTVMDIARTLGYPQSSTSELLSCLVFMGYLRRDMKARTYCPSARVAVMGASVQPRLFKNGALLPMMDELAQQSGVTSFLASRVDMTAQVIRAVGDGAEDLTPGHTLSLVHSAAGNILMSTVGYDQVREQTRRLNAEAVEADRVRPDDLVAALDHIRSTGYAMSGMDDDDAMISVLVPQSVGTEPLALGLYGPSAILSRESTSLVQMLRSAVNRRLGFAAVDAAERDSPSFETASPLAVAM